MILEGRVEVNELFEFVKNNTEAMDACSAEGYGEVFLP